MFLEQDNKSHNLSDILIDWWKLSGRSFPWRNSGNPYYVLIAEFMLRRTKACQVETVYKEFMFKFPSLEDLLNSSEDDIYALLHPLGLEWRNKSFLKLLAELKDVYRGIIPVDKRELMSLPGVGEYVASAVRCFAFGYPEIVMDTNTSRVISRIIGLEARGELRRNREIKKVYRRILGQENPKEINYALLDLGALICTKRNRKCQICPIKEFCSSCTKG